MKPLVRWALVGALLAAAGPAWGGEVKLSFSHGLVTLIATDASPREILSEWARLGQVRVTNLDRLAGAPVTLQMTDVPELRALETILRGTAGYVAAPRREVVATVSGYRPDPADARIGARDPGGGSLAQALDGHRGGKGTFRPATVRHAWRRRGVGRNAGVCAGPGRGHHASRTESSGDAGSWSAVLRRGAAGDRRRDGGPAHPDADLVPGSWIARGITRPGQWFGCPPGRDDRAGDHSTPQSLRDTEPDCRTARPAVDRADQGSRVNVDSIHFRTSRSAAWR